MVHLRRPFLALVSLLLFAPTTPSSEHSPRVEYIPYADARPILEELANDLPTELRSLTPAQLAVVWPEWVTGLDGQIRARLVQGDEDTIVNFLVFGTSFTHQPRLTKYHAPPEAEPHPLGGDATAVSEDAVLNARLDDLTAALAMPGNNERLAFIRRVMQRKGFNVSTPRERANAKQYLLKSFLRVLSEQAGYARKLESAHQLGDATDEFVSASTLFQDRGLSLDTSLLPDFAIEESLNAMHARGLLGQASVHRVAVIGPGLDFTDKDEGFDFYPQQTIQPFAVIDTLLRLGLSKPGTLELTTFDVSPRVNDHLLRARQRAERGMGYTVQLPQSLQGEWRAETIRYWEQFGDQIGAPTKPTSAPVNSGDLKIRAVRIRPTVVQEVTPVDLDAVLQRLDLPEQQKFDLIIATNIFLYYNVLEQCLALENVARMVRPGGFLVTNTALLEWPHSAMHAVDNLTVVYSNRHDGGHFVWYQHR
jgi:hypothetical protein